jgi:signal transduction histidine kinase
MRVARRLFFPEPDELVREHEGDMNADHLSERYQGLQAYMDWKEEDRERIHAVHGMLRPHLPGLVDDFYEAIERHPETRSVITGGASQVERLRGSLRHWLEELLSGPHDHDYLARRWQVGKRHVEVGLDQIQLHGAMARLRQGLIQALSRSWTGARDGLVATILSLNKLLDLELAILADAYQVEYLERLRSREYLAGVGQVTGSVGRELRGPLNVVKTSAYYLRHVPLPTPEKTTEHLQRIERHLKTAEDVVTLVCDYIGMPSAESRPFAVELCLEEALERTLLPGTIRVDREFSPDLSPALGDRRQILVAFVSLLRHAQTIMPDGGPLRVRGRDAEQGVDISFHHAGPGLSLESLEELRTAPTPLPRRLGLELIIARAILERNRGDLQATSDLGRGCTLTARLRAARRQAQSH